jgi:ABC-2 type transport system ATP-binding protein
MIEAHQLSKRFGDRLAVDDLSFSVAQGEVVGFLGPNGAGKTTTMRMLTGFTPPSAGKVIVGGHDLFEEPAAARRLVGYLPETPPLYPEMTVESYLVFVARIQGMAKRDTGEAVDRAMERCGLPEQRRRIIGDLSKGYRQRVGIAQAIVHAPPVLILDEPTVGLDPAQISDIRNLISDLSSPAAGEVQHAVILSTHILPEVEAICRRIIMIKDGTKRLDRPLDELKAEGQTLQDLFAREVVGESPLASSGEVAP